MLMIIFLDIDGVLNSRKHFTFRCSPEGQQRRDALLAQHRSPYTMELIMLDWEAVGLLQKFAIETQCKFVICSSWRERSTPEHFEKLFLLCGYPFPKGCVIGCTVVLDQIPFQKRGHEIDDWLTANRYKGIYFILDDDDKSQFLPDQPLIQTDRNVGLTGSNLAVIRKVVGEKHHV